MSAPRDASLHELSGAYTLHALDDHEAARFERHLEGCAACRDEVDGLRDAAAAMGAAEASHPPRRLRDRVLAAAAMTPQLPRESVADGPTSRPARPVEARLRRVSAWVAGLAVAAVLVVVAVLGAVVPRSGDDEPALAAAVVQVFDAPDAHTTTVPTDNGGRLRVATSATRDEMAVDTTDLPDLDAGRVYQLWAVSGDTTASAAVLDVPEEGAAMEMPAPGTRVILTVEPAGGSQQPTTRAIADVDPSSV